MNQRPPTWWTSKRPRAADQNGKETTTGTTRKRNPPATQKASPRNLEIEEEVKGAEVVQTSVAGTVQIQTDSAPDVGGDEAANAQEEKAEEAPKHRVTNREGVGQQSPRPALERSPVQHLQGTKAASGIEVNEEIAGLQAIGVKSLTHL